eukprot:6470567-Amphidinium_carterae.1
MSCWRGLREGASSYKGALVQNTCLSSKKLVYTRGISFCVSVLWTIALWVVKRGFCYDGVSFPKGHYVEKVSLVRRLYVEKALLVAMLSLQRALLHNTFLCAKR